MNAQRKASVTAWLSLVVGIPCFVLSVCFVISLFLPGGEYGRYADFFNFFFWGFMFTGPILGIASAALGSQHYTVKDHSKLNTIFSYVGLISGAISILVFILFLGFMGSMATCVMLHV